MTEHNIPKTDQTLWWKILLGMALGIAMGMILSPTALAIVHENTATTIGEWIALPGIIFLGLLKMVVIPLVITSIVLGVVDSGSLSFLKTMGSKIIPYFLMTTFISITIGVFVIQAINPCLLYTSPSPRDQRGSRMPSSA